MRDAKRTNAGKTFLIMLYHPFGAYEIIKSRRDEKSRIFPAILLLLLASLEKYAYNFAVSFQFSTRELNSVSLWIEMSYVIIPLALWAIANFCMTSIMDGESKFAEVFETSCYCLAPYIVLTPALALLSHILGAGEAGFYYFFQGATLVWVVLLLFVALLKQNNYGFFKALLVTFLCLVFMIIFAAVVVFLIALSIQLVSVLGEVLQEFKRKIL